MPADAPTVAETMPEHSPERPADRRRRLLLGFELVLLTIGIPLAFRLGLMPVHPFVVLWTAAIGCTIALVLDRSFDRRQLWNAAELRRLWPTIGTRFAILGTAIAAFTALALPSFFLAFPRENPGIWAMVMVFYPLLSVYPQGVIYRAFVLHRYRPLVPSRTALIAVSAVAFGFMHVIFRNPIAVSMTIAGGLLFAWTHLRSRSLLVSSIEHALYGQLIFTVGLGWFFYHGAIEYQDF